MTDQPTAARGPLDLRLLWWLGALVAAWLLLAPVASIEGASCGTPILNMRAEQPGPKSECVARNQVRRDQAIVTVAGTLSVAAVRTARRWVADAEFENDRLRALTYREEPGLDQADPQA